jgi:hypothetical protein
LVFSVIDAAHQATIMGLSRASFRACGICPYSSAHLLVSRYIRRAEEDGELEGRAANRQRLSMDSQVLLTSPEFLRSLRSRGGIAEVGMDPGGEVPDDGDFLNGAERDVSLWHTNGGEDGEFGVEL